MRIAHIITRLIVGGAQENTILSCEGQHDRGHEVTLITGPPIGPEGSLLERAQKYGYRVEVIDAMRRAIHPFWDYRSYKQLIDLLQRIRPDVVHTHSSKAGIIGRWAAHKAHVPLIVHTIHGLAFTASTVGPMNSMFEFAERKTAPITHRIVCVADAMREQSLAKHIGRPEQYVTVYSGMETGPFLNPPVSRSEVRRQYGIADDEIILGTIARLFHLKGHDDIIDLMADLCARFPKLRFLWVGGGLLKYKLQFRIGMMALLSRVIFTDLVPPARIPELANAMDVLVHPSHREGLARALPQGSLAGCPVIAYDIDGNREGVIDQQTGFVIPAFDKKKLAHAMMKLIADEPLRKQMGQAGRAFALARFDKNVMVDGLEQVYAQAVART
jgi:glycosyltransferase involved in cell wall biosynthesis